MTARRLAAVALLGGLVVTGPSGAVAADTAGATHTPSADAVLERVGFDAGDRQRVLGGEIVQRALAGESGHELGVAVALLVRAPAERITRALVEEALYTRKDPDTLAWGSLPADATVGDLAGLSLDADERAAYRRARAGEKVNFSEAELARLAAAGPGEDAIDAALRRVLIDRLAAYRGRGLDGLAPYARGGGRSTDPGAELRRAASAAPAVAGLDPGLARFLDGYPGASLPAYRDAWHWLRYRAHGEVSLVLVHAFSTSLGEAAVVVQRQFYVSRGYNVEQAVAAFVPVAEGTLAVYWNHTSTDQIGGLGAGVERSIGERLMGHQLVDLFERLRAAVD